MASPFDNNKVYSFDMWPAALYGASFKNVTVLGTISEKLARASINTREQHINAYPFLPVGTPNNPEAYEYIQIQTQQGEVTTLGIAWIKADSIQEISSRNYRVRVKADASELPRLRNALLTSNFKEFEIELDE